MIYVVKNITFLLLIIINGIVAQVRILEPPEAVSYVNNSLIEGATATFGAPYYGQKVEGELLFYETTGCTEDSYDLPAEVKNPSHQTPLIVMVRRGGCNFVIKVRVAENKGAKALLVADTKGSKSTQADISKVIVADDGGGKPVQIPSILLSDVDSNTLIAAGDGLPLSTPVANSTIRKDGRGVKTVMVELVWTLPKDHAVQVDIWTTPSSSESSKFLKEFAPYAKIFENRIDFQPHYWLLSLSRNYHDMCSDESADFCAFDPDLGGKTTGRMVVEETVRQLCLWEVTRTLDPNNPHSGLYSEQWWEYMRRLPETCPHDGEDPDVRFGKMCSTKLMESLHVNIRQVEKCVKNNSTTHLAHQLVNRAWAPSAILINKTRFSGPLDPELVARAICTAFMVDEEKCHEALHKGSFASGSKPKQSAAETLAVVAVVVFCFLASVGMIATIIYRVFLPSMEARLERSVQENVRKQISLDQESDGKAKSVLESEF